VSKLESVFEPRPKNAPIDRLLQSYYEYAERPKPERASTQSVCNWMDGNKPLLPCESTFLSDWDDLCALKERVDQGGLDSLLGSCAFWFRKQGFSWVRFGSNENKNTTNIDYAAVAIESKPFTEFPAMTHFF
jgi:hypothetical protein